MHRIGLTMVQPGSVLGKTIYNERGDVLLRKGAILSDRYIDLLGDKRFSTIYIQNEDTADIIIEDIVSEHVHQNATRNISRFLTVIENAARDLADLPLERLHSGFNSIDFQRSVQGKAFDALYSVVESIIDEVVDETTLSGLTAIKNHDNYTFCHSIDVTVSAVVLGRKLFFDRPALRQLALGCMLHDTGKIFIDAKILNKDSPLSPEEYAVVKRHPELGYQLLRSLQRDEFLANHVAYQHHESQDGSGYPRGLHGVNRISRDASRGDRILLIAEIAAVADVYDALSSDRPYRAGMTSEEIVLKLRELSGTRLNQEVVNHFLAILPVYPVGVEIRVTQGKLKDYRGVVARINPRAMDRPVVRILYDDRHRRVSAFEVDLLKEPHVEVATTFSNDEFARAS